MPEPVPDLMRLLVGYDGRPSGDDALALTRLLAPRGARVTVLVAVPFPPGFVGDPPPGPRPKARTWAELCEELTRRGEQLLEERARPQLPDLGFEPRVVLDDSPGRALTAACEEEQPDLAVVGSSNRGGVGRLLPGSTTERMLAGAPCAVAVAPRGYAEGAPSGIETVGVGFDGSESARQALATAAGIAARGDARLRVVAAVEPAAVGEIEVVEQALDILRDTELIDHRVAELRREATEACAAVGVSEERRSISVERGDAAEVLLEACPGLDLLVLGSRGYGPIRRVLLGSVSSRVVREATCPALVSPRD